MGGDQKHVLLSLLASKGGSHKASELLTNAHKYLAQQREASPSVFGTDKQESEDVWYPCIVWLLGSIPGLLSSNPPEARPPGRQSCVPLSDLLDACGISLVAFFKELPVVLNKLRPWLAEITGQGGDDGDLDSVLRLREWQETLVSLTHLANKYKDLFWHVQRSSSGGGAGKQPLLRAGWLAFLLIKAQLLPGFPDMVSCLELLVCVLNLLLASSNFSEQQLIELQQQSPAAIGASGRFNTLKALSMEAKVDFANTRELMPKIEERFKEFVEAAAFSWLPQPLPAELQHPQQDKLDTNCSLFLEGLVSNQQQLSELVLSLDAAYQTWYNQQGEIDEREFLLTDFGALASPRTLPDASILIPATAPSSHGAAAAAAAAKPSAARAAAAAAGSGSSDAAAMAVEEQQQQQGALEGRTSAAAQKERHSSQQQQQHAQKPPLVPGGMHGRKAGLMLQGLQSPLPMMALGPAGPTTPISQAMGSVAWLRGLVKGQGLEPSPGLQRFMEAAGPDAGRVLVSRVNRAAQAVFLSDGRDPLASGGLQGLQQGLAQERQAEGIKLYYHVLQAMLTAEEARAGLPAAGALLTRWPFHQCLLACAFEVVAASYRMGLLSFPAIPVKLGLKPFDLSKMIGPFVKAEPTLPRELKRHIFTVEEKILESLGWAPGSSFFTQLRAATGQQQQPRAAATAGVKQEQQQQDAAMQDADAQQQQQQPDGESEEEEEDSSALLPTAERQRDLQQEAAAAAAIDAEQAGNGGTPSATAAADSKRGTSAQGIKRGSEMGSAAAAAGDAMDTDASRASASVSPTRVSATAKRQKGQDGRPWSSQDGSSAGTAGPQLEDLPLPKALGPPPGSEKYKGAAAAGGDASARAVLHDYCKKVLKLAAFRMVAVSEGLDFSPMTREEVVAHVHELLSMALYQHTHLFYSRHLDTLLLASLYGFCKVNKLNQITFREIIAHYKRQAHAKQEVFRTVVLQQTDPHLLTQSTGDIIAFYNAVFVPAMKSMLLSVSQQQAAADAAAAGGTPLSANSVATGAAGAAARPSPTLTAMQLSAAPAPQQQQQQRLGASGAISPGGSAYRALSLPEPSGEGPASCSSLGLTGLSSGSSLLGGLGAPISIPPVAPGGGGSFWPGAEDGSGRPTAAELAAAAAGGGHAAAAAAAAGAGGSGPSRLSRLSRAGGGAATAVEGVALPLSGGMMQHHKSMGGVSMHGQQSSSGARSAAAAAGAPAAARAFVRNWCGADDRDSDQQQDQGSRGRHSGFCDGEEEEEEEGSEPGYPSGDGSSGDKREGSSEDGQTGSSSSSGPASLADGGPSGDGGVEGTPRQQQQQQGRQGLQGPRVRTTAVGASPLLATLMQGLNTKSVSPAVRRT